MNSATQLHFDSVSVFEVAVAILLSSSLDVGNTMRI